MNVRIESPAEGAVVDPLCIRIFGTLEIAAGEDPPAVIEAVIDGEVAGETRLFPAAPDGTGTFQILGCRGAGFGTSNAEIEIRATSRIGNTHSAACIPISFSAFDNRICHYGQILAPEQTGVLHREHIYGSGPPVAAPSPECCGLLLRFLGTPPGRILDAGCGIGAYAAPLKEAGFDWHGAEVSASHCAQMTARNLPHTHIDGASLPFADQAFDAAIAIEVMEHVPDPDAFLREIARVAPRLCLSVPNIELIPYLQRYVVVPWHLLEADHKNFFTRWNLKPLLQKHFSHVEIITYGELPLRTPEGDRLDLHLFAVASR